MLLFGVNQIGFRGRTRANVDAAQKYGVESAVVRIVSLMDKIRYSYSTSTPCDSSALRFFIR